jgi:hypothetical protein
MCRTTARWQARSGTTSRSSPIEHDLTVKNNKPGGASVVGNYARHNAVCQKNGPQTGSGNHAAGSNGRPA